MIAVSKEAMVFNYVGEIIGTIFFLKSVYLSLIRCFSFEDSLYKNMRIFHNSDNMELAENNFYEFCFLGMNKYYMHMRY